MPGFGASGKFAVALHAGADTKRGYKRKENLMGLTVSRLALAASGPDASIAIWFIDLG